MFACHRARLTRNDDWMDGFGPVSLFSEKVMSPPTTRSKWSVRRGSGGDQRQGVVVAGGATQFRRGIRGGGGERRHRDHHRHRDATAAVSAA